MGSINSVEAKTFSQNGEDGIIGYLTARLTRKQWRFVEIGTSDGAENNTFHLLTKGWTGIGIDASAKKIAAYERRVAGTALAANLKALALSTGWDSCKRVLDEL